MISRKKTRKLIVLCLVGIVFVVLLNAQWGMLKYRFFIRSPSASMTTNVKCLAGSFIDSTFVLGNSSLMVLDNPSMDKEKLMQVPAIRLKVELGSFEKMASNLPESAKARYYKGQIEYPDGSWKNVDYRFRGRNVWHWHPDKPSLRIKLSKKNPLHQQRAVNLVNPEDRPMVSNVMGELLARKMGVLTHVTDYCRLYVNGNYFGVYHRTTREDEEMLRLNNRIPGPLYVGDHLKETWKTEQFEVTGELKSLGKFNPMDEMLAAMNLPLSVARYEQLWKIFSKDKLARWHASTVLVGGIHTDYNHNHLYYFDPALGKLEPIVSDMNGYGLLAQQKGWPDRLKVTAANFHEIPINERLQPLLDVALRDPSFLSLRNNYLFEALQSIGSLAGQKKELEKIYAQIDTSVLHDTKKGSLEAAFIGWFRLPYGNRKYETAKNNLLTWIGKRNEFLLSELNKVEGKLIVEKVSDDRQRITVIITGNAGLRLNLESLNFDLWKSHPVTKQLQRVSTDVFLPPGLIENMDPKIGITNSERFPKHYLTAGTQSYVFEAEMKDFNSDLTTLRNAFSHSLTKEKVVPELIQQTTWEGLAHYDTNSIHAWTLHQPRINSVVELGPGTVDLTKDLIVDEDQTLIVRKGTRIRLNPGVSIASLGRVEFQGTADEQIVMERMNPDDPWGCLIIQGKAANNSKLEYSTFKGGSLDRVFNVNYSGMVSIHGLDNVEIRNCHFEHNIVSDDTLHVVYGFATLENLTLTNCFSDAIDLDYVDATISNVAITHTGNDGLDLMTTQATISDLSVEFAGDKGISIGENSSLVLSGADISNAVIGIAVKDASDGLVINSTLRNNLTAIDIFKKNWRYGVPGKLSVKNTAFVKNEMDLKVAEFGHVEFQDSNPVRIFGDGTIVGFTKK